MMTTNEIATACGVTANAVTAALRAGKLKGTRREDPSVPAGCVWEVESTMEEAKAHFSSRRVRYRPPTTPTQSSIQYRAARRSQPPMPANRDLFNPEETSKLVGISETTVKRYVRENGITVLRNGRGMYLTRANVEAMREKFAPREVVAPRVLVQSSDGSLIKALHRVEDELGSLREYITRFAASCGFKE